MAPTATEDNKSHGNTPVEEEDLIVSDDLLRLRAADEIQVPLLCFPKSERGTLDYEEFTGRDIDRFVDHAAKFYMKSGLKPTKSSHETPPVIALLCPTDLAYIVTFFALARLGYTSLCLSPRLAPNACEKLIRETGAIALIPGKTSQMCSLVAQTQKLVSIEVVKLIAREEFDKASSKELRFQRQDIDRQAEKEWTLGILHSSGSTGLPKPICLTHRRLMMKIPTPKGQTEFNTFPFFHGYGSWVVLHGMMYRKTVYMYNPNVPVTADYIIKVLEHVRPDVLHVVPYTMELLAQTKRGVDAMKHCKRVVFSGSAAPDDLGNDLVARGVNLETLWGATEMGSLGNSFNRAPGDISWDYIRMPPPVAKNIWMKPLGDDTYECIYLQGLEALAVSNSDDPPGSFHSKDVFVKHPTLDAWKHIGRLDDRLTLINGEKVLPVPMEGRIRQDPLIRECCIFGTGKSIPGIFVFRNNESKAMSDETFIDVIWPTIQKANAQAESFSQISKDTIVPFGAEVDYPKTDKESIKRAQIYRVFAQDMEAMYEKLEYSGTGTLQLDVPTTEKWIMETFKEALTVYLSSPKDDFFAAGVNSLQAIQMRGLILKNLDLGGDSRKLGQNVIFETANVACLAKHLYALRVNKETPAQDEDGIGEMQAMINKYSMFKKHVPGSSAAPQGHVVVLTGATGSLGAHILAQLLNRADVYHVYCLVRGQKAQERVLQALRQRSLSVPDNSLLTALTSDLSKADLGLSPEMYKELRSRTTSIIHCSWAVNFNIGIRSFEDQHIKGVHNLTQLSLSVTTPAPARFFFCSSIATALGTPPPATIRETPISNLKAALPLGYARSKLVSEQIVCNAARDAGALTRILRIGQIVGDGKMGLWNDTEAIPLMIRSALTLKALPALDETESWLPVDTLATVILDLAGLSTGAIPAPDSDTDLVYNLENPHTFSWTSSLLPELQRSGLEFSTVPTTEWLQKLRDYEKGGGNPERNPAVKLIGHFESIYGKEKIGDVKFATDTAQKHSQALKEAPRLIEEGYIEKFVKAWVEKWQGEGKDLQIESSG
ncbi:MAG: hypothetical protein ALECFALPRED_001136 [Alectoria fallacina]|uniref:Acetyl-CoA synthetase-like protein n=1 Tax=Alectoria fallacina TaxID=1903189 RepID=A0A8H3IMQ8_9LECA|nr:MAG: hypothetical protein ALECFALPRED_001136 [Alectoria fallacina]